MKASMRVALCGMVAAVSVALMFLTGLVPAATLALPALTGCILICPTAQLGVRWGFGVYAVCAVLSFLLAPDREAAIYYILFFGYYPVLTAVLGRIKNRVLRWAVKLAIFNGALALAVCILVAILGPLEDIPFLGRYTKVVLWALAIIMFLLYDVTLDRLVDLYYRRLHDRIARALRSKK